MSHNWPNPKTKPGKTGKQAASALLTPKERLAKLDRILGKGIGAKKERERIKVLLESSSN